jgi:hypothetical protein
MNNTYAIHSKAQSTKDSPSERFQDIPLFCYSEHDNFDSNAFQIARMSQEL